MQQSLGETLICSNPLSNLDNSGWFPEKCFPQLPSNAGWRERRVLLSQFLRVFFLLFKSVCFGSIFSKHLDKTWRVNAFLAKPEGMLCCVLFLLLWRPGNWSSITQSRWSASPKASSGSLSTRMQTSLPGYCLDWKCNRDRKKSVEYNSDRQLCMVLQERQTSSESEVVGRKVAKSQLVPKHLEI